MIRSPAIAPVATNTTAPEVSRIVDSKRPLKRSPERTSRRFSRTLSVPDRAPADGGACWRMKRKNAVIPPPRTVFHAPWPDVSSSGPKGDAGM